MSRKKRKGLQVIKKIFSLILLSIIICEIPLRAIASESPKSDSSIIVSLGDSYSSGEGIEPFFGQDLPISEKVNNYDWLAHRSKNAWSGMLTLPSLEGTMSNYKDENWYFVAASGATTANIEGEFDKEYYKKQLSNVASDLHDTIPLPPQTSIFQYLKEQGKQADYVTLTIGGNDVDFTGAVIAAVCSSTYLTPAYLTDKINTTWKNFYEGGIRDDICDTYKKLCDIAGEQAQILVAGYPQLLDSSGSILLFNDEVAKILNRAVSQFNDAIESIIYDYRLIYGYNIWFISVEESFQGHGAYSDDSYLNGVIIGRQSEDIDDSNPISAYSMHPNKKGACAYAECVQAKIDELEMEISEPTNSEYNTDINITVYDNNFNKYDNYTVDISGTYNTGWFGWKWFGWFEEDYSAHYVVDNSNSLSISLNDNGNYRVTVTDNSGSKNSYSKDITVSKDYVNKHIAFSTDFGSMPQPDIGGKYDKSNIMSGAVEFNGHYYKVIQDDTITDWNAALQYCNAQNGYLATITSQEENDFLYSYIKQEGYESAYFGLSDAISEGTWAWANGEAVTYTNWHKNEPNGENSGEDYALFYYKYSDGTWNDGDFGNRTVNSGTAFICEWGEYTVRESEKQDEPIRTTSDERDIVLVLDVSGSMSGTPMEETKKASVNFIDTILDEDASIGIVTYDNSASMLSDFSVNKSTLTNAVSDIWDGGGTNIEAGLAEAHSMLSKSSAKKKIIVLMSDGEPNDGKEGDDLIAYADELKDDGIIIYTLGFFENMGSYKSYAQLLMEGIASDGCHYEVASADDLVFFFEDVADQINGQKYIYIRIACPVDVTVTYKGETLCSAEDDLNVRTDFGTLNFEDNENISGEKQDDRIKVLRLKEGADYDVQIVGTGHGIMDYTIGFMDENGDYSDFRRFENIKITRRTTIDTVAAVSKESVLNIDEDGDGKYDLKLSAEENGYGEEVEESIVVYVVISGVALLLLSILLFAVQRNKKIKETKEKN